jgi:hypothetical protein
MENTNSCKFTESFALKVIEGLKRSNTNFYTVWPIIGEHDFFGVIANCIKEGSENYFFFNFDLIKSQNPLTKFSNHLKNQNS